MPHDFIAIGDIVTDAFIKLHDAEVHKHMRTETRDICLPWGTKIPYDGVVVVPGVCNCANAAVAAARLGLTSALVTNTGDDEIGQAQKKTLENNHVSTEFVHTHTGKPSNYHYVLSFKGERTILVKHEEYLYMVPEMGNPKWIYLTSLSQTSENFHNEIADWLEAHPDVNLVFQPGTFQIKMSKDPSTTLGVNKLARIYARTNIFFCNIEEAQTILDTKKRDIRKLSEAVRELGPKIVCLTDGTDGAYAFDGTELWFTPQYPDPKPPLDRTGAGDAFASTFSVAIALGKTLPEALSWGPINSMSVVQYYGAQEGLLSREKLEQYLASAPAEYKVKKM